MNAAGTMASFGRWYERPAGRATVVACMTLFFLFARRYAQMLDPQVWDEEGRIIAEMVKRGPLSFAIPMNGYLIVLPRLIAFVALLGPIGEYPRVAVLLSWAVVAALMVAIAIVPSRLHGGPLLVLSALLVPSDPEVYGLPLYTFWWTIPLVYASYFWRLDGRTAWWRLVAIVLCGLSAPAIVPVAPLFVLRAIRTRTRDAIAAAGVATACALLQIIFIVKEGAAATHPSFAVIVPAIGKLIGGYMLWNLIPNGAIRDAVALLCGLCIVFLVGFVVRRDAAIRSTILALSYLWIMAVLLTLARVDLGGIDPAVNGPRYFFLPFLIEGWIVLQIALASRFKPARTYAFALLACAAFNTMPVLSRTHADLGWQQAIVACTAPPEASLSPMPVEFAGAVTPHWTVDLSGYECRQLSRFGLTGLLFGRHPQTTP